MLLEELTTSDLNLLAKALAMLGKDDAWGKLEKHAYNSKALEEAVTLYNWAINSNNANFGAEYEALSHLLALKSMGGTLSACRRLQKSGFLERNFDVHNLWTESIVKNPARFKSARQNAIPFVKAVRTLFYSLKVLGDVATPGTKRNEANDGLARSVSKAVLKKLGIKGDSFFVNA